MTYEAFYTTYRAHVQRTLQATIGSLDQETCDDLTQETFLKAWKAWARVDQGHLSAWITRVARNTAIDYLRIQHGRQAYLCAWDEAAALNLPDERGATLVWSGDQELLQQAWARLKPSAQQVLALSLQGYTDREIAARLDGDYSLVRKRLYSIRKQFRACYQALAEEGSAAS